MLNEAVRTYRNSIIAKHVTAWRFPIIESIVQVHHSPPINCMRLSCGNTRRFCCVFVCAGEARGVADGRSDWQCALGPAAVPVFARVYRAGGGYAGLWNLRS